MESEMKTIGIVIPWFGEFHNYFDLWMISAGYNPTVDFYIVTDNQILPNTPPNIHFVYSSLEEIKERIQKICGFKIKLTAYKLCDFKPLFGLIFEDLLRNYDYWGYCDTDLIFGNIRKFMTPEVLSVERVLQRGHFSLYANTEKMLHLYKKTDLKNNMAYSYKKAWRTNYSCYFDEYFAMGIVTDLYCSSITDHSTERIVLDVPTDNFSFYSRINKFMYYCYWENGRLYRVLYDKKISQTVGEPEEFMYVHLQKRKMNNGIVNDKSLKGNRFYIIPNEFSVNCEFSISEEQEKQYTKQHYRNDKIKMIKKLLRFGPIDCIPHRVRIKKIDMWLRSNKTNF